MNNVKMYRNIFNHGENLKKVFNLPADTEPVKLCKKLFSLEVKAHKLAEDYCNGVNNVDSETWEPLTDKILEQIDKFTGFKNKGIPVFVNGDARGYALKIDDEYVRANNIKIHKDWGGYGIIAPDFRDF